MRIYNVAKIGVLLLCILLVLPLMTGCADDLVEKLELVQIKREWESIIQKENSDIAKIVIISGEVQPVYSSTFQSYHTMTLDEKEQIDAVIKILSEPDVSWEYSSNESEESTSFYESHYGMQEMEFCFFDSDGQAFLKINIYENNECCIYAQPEIISESHVRWHGYYRMIFSEDIYQSLNELQKSFES